MIFIDTGAFIARYIQDDQYHGKAVELWKRLEHRSVRLFTSNFVLDETLTLLGRRAGYPFAVERARVIYASEVLSILRPSEDSEYEAIDLFSKYADQKVSFTDCVSFALMHHQKITQVFSFDHHFEMAGFSLYP